MVMYGQEQVWLNNVDSAPVFFYKRTVRMQASFGQANVFKLFIPIQPIKKFD